MIDEYIRQYIIQQWPAPTMDAKTYEETRGCSSRQHNCSCFGYCPVRLERLAKAEEHDRKRRDWRHKRPRRER